jgi:hypothetical protein
MMQLRTLESGSRHDLRVGRSPDSPDEGQFRLRYQMWTSKFLNIDRSA